MKSLTGLLLTVMLLAGYPTQTFSVPLQANTSDISVMLSPNTVATSGVRWTVRLVIPYCGGYKVGKYVLLRFKRPFVLPPRVPSAAVSFADGPAEVVKNDDSLEVAPAAGRMWSMLCGATLPLDIVVSARAGLRNPAKPGTYAIEISTDADPTPVAVPVVVRLARP